MWRRALSLSGAMLLAATACQGDTTPRPAGIEPGAGTASQAVEQVATAVAGGAFEDASHLAVPGQAALASLLEGPSFEEVATALETNDQLVVANFWSGFAQGAGVSFTEPIEATDGEMVTEGEVTFHSAVVTLSDGTMRTVYTRDVDGHRVDLFASFGAGLADKMILPVERMLNVGDDESDVILDELQTIVPSLLVAAEQPGLSPQSIQDLLRLVELITRVS